MQKTIEAISPQLAKLENTLGAEAVSLTVRFNKTGNNVSVQSARVEAIVNGVVIQGTGADPDAAVADALAVVPNLDERIDSLRESLNRLEALKNKRPKETPRG